MIRKLLIIRLGLAAIGVTIGLGLAGDKAETERADVSVATPKKVPVTKRDFSEEWKDTQNLGGSPAYDAKLALAEEMPWEEIEQCVVGLRMPFDIDILKRLLVRLAAHDPWAALAALDAVDLPEEESIDLSGNGYHTTIGANFVRNDILKAWAVTDGDAALPYALDLAYIASENSTLSPVGAVIAGIGKTSPERAKELARKYGLQEEFLRNGGGTLNSDMEMLNSLSEVESRDWVLSEILIRYSSSDSSAVLKAIKDLPPETSMVRWTAWRLPDEWQAEIMLHQQGEALQTEDYALAETKFVRSQNPVQNWASKEPRAALAWVENFPENARDHQRALALVGASLQDPEFAVGKLDILSAGKRVQAAESIFDEWRLRDPVAAEAWVETLEEDLRERLRE